MQLLTYALQVRHPGQLLPLRTEQLSWEGTDRAVSDKGVGTMQRMLSWDPNPGVQCLTGQCWADEGRGRNR